MTFPEFLAAFALAVFVIAMIGTVGLMLLGCVDDWGEG